MKDDVTRSDDDGAEAPAAAPADLARPDGSAFELRIPVSVVAERRAPVSRWAEPSLRPMEVFAGRAPHAPGTVLREGEPALVHLGTHEIVLHRKDTAGVALNLTGDAVLYVIMRPDIDGTALHGVTASDHEAQDHTDAGEDVVERVPMPAGIRETIEAFLARHHVEEPFHKRKRKKDRPEEHKFGQQPIFEPGGRR